MSVVVLGCSSPQSSRQILSAAPMESAGDRFSHQAGAQASASQKPSARKWRKALTHSITTVIAFAELPLPDMMLQVILLAFKIFW